MCHETKGQSTSHSDERSYFWVRFEAMVAAHSPRRDAQCCSCAAQSALRIHHKPNQIWQWQCPTQYRTAAGIDGHRENRLWQREVCTIHRDHPNQFNTSRATRIQEVWARTENGGSFPQHGVQGAVLCAPNDATTAPHIREDGESRAQSQRAQSAAKERAEGSKNHLHEGQHEAQRRGLSQARAQQRHNVVVRGQPAKRRKLLLESNEMGK